ncbi:SRPBCC domain-containing protein [Streptomyces sp. NPDC004327]|uniref:SRPBCC family protein n=1 Tax=unclassified Streptomyces TaxID=2593676 RepID=UPI003693C7DC
MTDQSATDTIHCAKFLAHPPAAVWAALTEPGLHVRWWAAGDVKPVVGHRFTLDMGDFGVQPCEVTEVEDERLFTYRFAEGTLDTTITWRLEPEGTGTRLFLTHAGFDLDSPLGRQAFAGMTAGWPHVIDRLVPLLDEESGASAAE